MCGHNLPLPKGLHSLLRRPVERLESRMDRSSSPPPLAPAPVAPPLSTAARQSCLVRNGPLKRNELHSAALARSCLAGQLSLQQHRHRITEWWWGKNIKKKVATLRQLANCSHDWVGWRVLGLANLRRAQTPASSTQTTPSAVHIRVARGWYRAPRSCMTSSQAELRQSITNNEAHVFA